MSHEKDGQWTHKSPGCGRVSRLVSLASSSGSSPSPFGYAGGYGYQEDATGLKLLGHRYYDPTTGRFLTRDPIRDGSNWHAYCGNNPLRWVDPDGLKPKLVVIIGDLGKAGGAKGDLHVGAILLIAALYDQFGDEYEIAIRFAKSPEQVDEHLAHADVAVFIGHGWGFSTGKRSWLPSIFRLFGIYRNRKAKKRPPLAFVLLCSCSSFDESIDNWHLIAQCVFGFEEKCFPGRSSGDLFGAGGKGKSFTRKPPVKIGGGSLRMPGNGGVR